jgi:hypothetical protein
MKIKELDNVIDEILEQETKKLIKEQIENEAENNDSASVVKKFQTLSGLVEKISDIADIGDGSFGVVITINNVGEDELINCCGGSSAEEAEQNLMQGLHHDLEDSGIGNNFDIDIDGEGDEGTLNLKIKITGNNDELSGDNGMEEKTEESQQTDLRSFGQELYESKESGKENFTYQGKEYNVNECWKQLEEQEAMNEKKEIILGDKKLCKECGKALPTECKKEVCDECAGKKQEVSEDDKWIQKAVNPKHKGFCTPMTKKTCTPQRKALAKRFKKGIEKESVKAKRVITLSEEGMRELLTKIINETAPGGVPGYDTLKATRSDSGKENADALKDVEKIIKDYLSFKGNDNPEFPNPIGKAAETMARQNSEKEDEVVSDNRGRGPQDLDYDAQGTGDDKLIKKHKERLKLSLLGDPKMGNSQDAAGVVKTDTGKKMVKAMERRIENKKKEPLYPKEPVPIKNNAKEEIRLVSEDKKNVLVTEDIQKMKRMSSYNEKTQ